MQDIIGIIIETCSFQRFLFFLLTVSGHPLGTTALATVDAGHGVELGRKVPGMEEELPVDVRNDLCHRDLMQHRTSRLKGYRWLPLLPIYAEGVLPGLFQCDQLHLLLCPVFAQQCIIFANLPDVGIPVLSVQQVSHRRGALGGIFHIYHRSIKVFGFNLQCRMQTRSSSTTNKQWQGETLFLHLGSHHRHLLKRGSDQAAETYHVGLFPFHRFNDLLGGNHHAQVYDLVVIACKDDGDDVLADVMHISLHRSQHDLACLL